MIDELKTWWSDRSPRERLVVFAGGGILLAMLLWAFVWHPLAESRSVLAQRVSDQQRLLNWMENASADVRQARARTAATAGSGPSQSLLGLVDESLRAHGLGAAVRRVEPDGPGIVRLWLDGARFDDLMSWLVTLDRGYGTVVDELSAQATDARGVVNASLTVRR